MPSRRRVLPRILLVLALFIMGCPPPAPPREFIIEGIGTVAEVGLTFLGEIFFLAPDSRGAFVLQVRNPDTDQPLPNARVQISLATPGGSNTGSSTSTPIFEGRTDDRGIVEVSFDVPAEVENPNQVLVVNATGGGRTITYQEEVYVGRVYNVMVSTDKPVYQPGQVIHIRGLALDTLKLEPAAGEPLVMTVSDPDGNKLMRRELTTSRYGVAAADFTLDSQAPQGDYIITAEMGPVSSSRSVEVKPYNLPRFKVNFSADKPFYLPGETATGEVQAEYFFGKPVAGGQVTLRGYVTDVDRFQVFELAGVTDDQGIYNYEFTVPDYFVGQLENNAAEVELEITVVDTADHAESIDDTVVVAEKPILIEGVPESGFLRPQVENIIYLDTSYPDGRAAAATLEVSSPALPDPLTLETDAFGLATFRFTPTSSAEVTLTITATDRSGVSAVQELVMGASEGDTTVLLRPDKAEYRIGETMQLDIYVAGPASTVYLDIIKGRQSFALTTVPVRNGIAQAALDIDGSLLGTLELNAYVITAQGKIVRDRRLALVNPAPAEVTITTDAPEYRPGETATIEIAVQREGAPMPGVLGVSIVDESVFSVQSQDPGFARTYFLLERELLEPRYEIHGFPDLDDDDHSPYDDNPDSFRTVHRPDAPEIAGGFSTVAAKPAPVAVGGSQSSDRVRSLSASRQTALTGLFAEELAADGQKPPLSGGMESGVASQVRPPASSSLLPTANSLLPIPWLRGWAYRMALALPLIGLALYDGTQRRRRLLLAALLMGVISLILAACSGAAPAAPAASEAAPAGETTATRGEAATTRLRQYFPETLLWMPEIETDAQGRARISVPVADSITTWRISVLASDAEGNLGSAETGMRVFQEFFVEPDLPRFLTVGDEIDVPVSLYNYLDEPQTVEISVQRAGWFELRGDAVQTVTLAANQVAAAYIPIRVVEHGLHEFQVTAEGDAMSDAVLRQVEVLPNGQQAFDVLNGRLGADQTFDISIPATAIPGASNVTVKLYPGIISQVIDGLEGLLHQPYGCFEQTSSATYPNVLVLDYLRTTGRNNPAAELAAEYYINSGYQRLLTFEVRGNPGGFSLFGDPPPATMLTAYGLMEMSDMSRVSYVDPAVLERMATFLMDRQNADGSWTPQDMTVSGPDGGGTLAATAYIAWAMADAGYAQSEPVARALSYLDANTPVAESDSYVLALVANAYAAAPEIAPASVQPVLNALADRASPVLAGTLQDQPAAGAKDSVRWNTEYTTWLRSYGDVANLETTALAAHALLRARHRLDLAEQAVEYIISQRNAFGAYHTTQATIISLKTLLLATQIGGEGGSATVTITLDDGRSQTVTIDDENADVVQQVSFDDLSQGEHALQITVEGDRAVQYQVITGYYRPWTRGPGLPKEKPMRLDVAYDRTELRINDMVRVQATLELLQPGVAGTVLVDLGIPPGFSPVTSDLDALVEQGLVSRYELTGRQIIFYLTDVPSGQVYTLSYRLLARYPIRAQTPPSIAYDYYTPDTSDDEAPERITVTLGTPNR